MTANGTLEFRLLGSLEASIENRPLSLGGPRQRALLAILLLRANEVVARDRLIDELWSDEAPEGSANALAALVARLRRVLPREVLVTRSGGYELLIEPDAIDLPRFERLVDEGSRALKSGDAPLAAERLRSALCLWRGPPLADFAYEPFAESAIRRLEELRLVALEDRIDADLALGRHADLVGELQELLLEHPLRERFRVAIMLALYRSGRQAEALEAYQQARHALVDELGLEPSEELQRLERAILQHDPSLTVNGAAASPVDGGVADITAEPRRERRIISVLCAELIDSDVERVDPEDAEAVVRPYHELLRRELERFGGSVERFVGDSVTAVFGAPVAHEDDPERAVRAALAIRDAVGEKGVLGVRLAVSTGEAIVRLDPRPDEGIAIGEVVNIAAKLQAAAPVGGILVNHSTHGATAHAIEYREAEPVEAVGNAEPVPVWETLEARTRLGSDVRRLGRTPFVGRERELDALSAALGRVREEREPQLVTLVGVPGIGKSRLCFELFRVVEQDPKPIRWRQGRCLPYGEGVSFWALGEIVKTQAGILESDDDPQSAEKLRRAVEQVAETAEAQWLERHLRPLVGLQAETELTGDRRDEAFAAWRRFLERLAEERPLVCVFEDLHFADEGLLDFVDHLAEWASGVPLLVLCTARPELTARRPGWSGGKANATTLSLPPLSDEKTAQLVHALLGQPLLDAELQATVVARAEGNPLYAEELVRLIAERKESDELPVSVQGIIAARLGALPDGEKELIQDAAVIGKVFWLGALPQATGDERAAAERRLHALERKEFVRRARRSSVAGETEYAFRHVLLRDVAYGQIPRGRRADKHSLAAAWIEALGRPDDHAELLAHHYLAALELARAGGKPAHEVEPRARLALRDAGERALALNAFAQAKRFFAAALELCPRDDPERPQLLFRHGKVQALAEEAGDGALAAAADVLVAVGDRETAAEAEVLLAELAFFRGEGDLADEHLARAAKLTAGLTPSRSTAYVLSSLARSRMLAGMSEDAIQLSREALELAERLALGEIRARALATIGSALVITGDPRGVADLERAVKIALAAHSRECVRAYNSLSVAHGRLGDTRRARELTVEGLQAAERFGDVARARALRGTLVWFEFISGRWDESLHLANEFIAETEAGSPHYQETEARSMRATIRLARGDAEGALADAERGLELARDAKDPQDLAPGLAHYARCLLARGRAQAAAPAAREALAIARKNAVVLADDWPVLAFVLTALGHGEELVGALVAAPRTPWIEAARRYAGGDFVPAADLYAKIGSLPDEADARLRAAEQFVKAGRRGEANAQLEQALAFYRSVGATRYIREGEALLATVA